MVDPGYFRPFDLGEVLRNVEALKTSRFNRQQAQDEMTQRKAEREALGSIFAPGGGIDESGATQSGRSAQRAKLGDLYRVNPEMGFKVQQYLDGLDKQSREVEVGKWKAAAPILVGLQQVPYEQRKAHIRAAAPVLMANGWSPEEIQSFDPTDVNVQSLSSAAMTVDQVVNANKLDWHQIGEQGSFATDRYGNPVGQGNPFAPQSQNTAQKQPGSINDVFSALIQQESGGRPGVRGQQTAYGIPLGMTQMLPETAKAMAQKLGMQFSPDMLTGTSPEAASIQQKLGRAYFDEGLQKYGGNVEKALMYYHGGPDEGKWGPKTRTYAKAILARVRKSAGNPEAIRAKAQAAIAAGADPEAVKQRAAALGVTL